MSDAHHRSEIHPSSKRARRRVRAAGPTSHDTGSWDRKAVDGSAAALLLRGQAVEGSGDARGALTFYERAMALPEQERHPLDTGSILHHVGNCASMLGERQRAFDAYLAAISVFDAAMSTEYLAKALGELGLLLIHFYPTTPVGDVVDADLVWKGFKHSLAQAGETLMAARPPTFRETRGIHRTFTGLMVLAGFASLDASLVMAGRSLFHSVAAPFAERHQVFRRTAMDDFVGNYLTFSMLSRLCEAVGEQEKPDRAESPPSREEVKVLAGLTADAFFGAPHVVMATWLGSYLRERRGATWATDEVLPTWAARHDRASSSRRWTRTGVRRTTGRETYETARNPGP